MISGEDNYTPPSHPPIQDNHPTREHNFGADSSQGDIPSGFAFNANEASEGSVFGMKMEGGKYVGLISHCQHIQSSKKNTQGILFDLDFNTGQKTTIRLYSEKQIIAVMQCVGFVGHLTPMHGTVKEYDKNAGQMVQRQGYVYPQLVNKPLGVVLKREDYQREDGGLAYEMKLVAPFNPQTEQSAREIIANKPPHDIAQAVKSVLIEAQQQAMRPRPKAKRNQSQDYQAPNGNWADDTNMDNQY